MITLVLGGTRSGKSAVAERLAAQFDGPVTYAATARLDPADRDHARRIEAHRLRRPTDWVTVECLQPEDLIDCLETTTGTVLVESLGTWVSSAPDLVADVDALIAALGSRASQSETTRPTVIVSEEVGLAVHPPTELGRRYVDVMGALNQRVAKVSDRVLLVVAGRTIELSEAAELDPFQPGDRER